MTTTEHCALPAGDDGPTGFQGLGLPAHLLEAVLDLGFEDPTEIQAAAIPALLSGRDIVGVAQTGTGKTAAFGLPLLEAIDPGLNAPQALVLAPTRELAIQVADAIGQFARTSPGLLVATVYGGAPYGPQIRDLKAGAQVVVGTPGRIIDHLERGALTLDGLRFLVLDEGDEMLRMGFAEEVDRILSQAPADRLTALFSATMPPDIRRTADKHLRDPLHIAVTASATVADNVDQRYAVVPHKHKVSALARILATTEAEAAIVFVRTRADAEEVAQDLIARGVNAAGISGDVAQRERERMVERLRSGRLDVLVATDVAARGLDVDRVGLVVNYDLPREPGVYVHRIGRTGRAGRSGVAFTFITPGERGRLRAIEKTIKVQITERPVPTRDRVTEHRYASLLRQVSSRIAAGGLEIAYRAVAEAMAEGVDPVALAAGLAALGVRDDGPGSARSEESEVDTALAELRERELRGSRSTATRAHQPARAARYEPKGSGFRVNRGRPNGHQGRETGPGARRGDRPGANRYWIGVGRGHGANPGAIVGAITGETRLSGADLGSIEMFQHFSLVEIDASLSQGTMRQLAKTRVAGRELRIRPDAGHAVR
ncbi:MAG: DEAD/DEAH box helicase [Propionibacteriaceae bacterium]|jgi:ATP-dependent RNA helicase DeaD|nr:DEAD/DEAH box helicase [Propionibacteriaceae bacterium]